MKNAQQKRTPELPPIGDAVWAECKDTWTLAYLDENGIWRAVADSQPLQIPTKGIRNWLICHYRRPAFILCQTLSPSSLCSFAV